MERRTTLPCLRPIHSNYFGETFQLSRRDGRCNCRKSSSAATDVFTTQRLPTFISLHQPRESIMLKPLSYVLVASLLTACGGGGGGAGSGAAPAASTPPPAAAAPAPVATSPAVVLETPPAAPSGTKISGRQINQNSSGGNMSLTFTGMTDLNVGGDLNRLWLAAAQPGGTVTVGGASNTIVFGPSATPTTVTVTGSANTFYLPQDSKISLSGAGAAMSTIKYYKP
jgi:hypothetical protein